MKRTGLAILSLCVLLASTVAWSDEPGPEKETDADANFWTANADFTAGFADMFLNMNQFHRDLKALGLMSFDFPLAEHLSFGANFWNGPHCVFVSVGFAITELISHQQGRLADFTYDYGDLSFGYRYRPHRVVAIFASVAPSLDRWSYVLAGGKAAGAASGLRYGFDPAAGVSLYAAPGLAFNFWGGYQVGFARDAELYSGGLDRAHYGHWQLDHATAGIDLMAEFK